MAVSWPARIKDTGGLREQFMRVIDVVSALLEVTGIKVVATKKMEKTLPMILQWDESFDVGSDTLTGVNDADYRPPFTFTGKLEELTVKVDRPRPSAADIKRLEEAQRNNKMSE